MPDSPYSLAFDREAADYDARFNARDATRSLREWLWRQLRAAFPPGSSVLDIGCGTGEDAAAIARSGVRVLGIDVSPAMVARARAKCSAELDLGATDFRVCDVSRLDDVPPLDGILSNFGALNCLASLDPIRRLADRRLKPGGRLFLVLINRWYLRELAGLEFRRLRPSGSLVRCGEQQIAVHYHPPHSLRWTGYRVRTIAALGSWSRSDIHTRWPLNRLGDHYLAVLEKAARADRSPAPPARGAPGSPA